MMRTETRIKIALALYHLVVLFLVVIGGFSVGLFLCILAENPGYFLQVLIGG